MTMLISVYVYESMECWVGGAYRTLSYVPLVSFAQVPYCVEMIRRNSISSKALRFSPRTCCNIATTRTQSKGRDITSEASCLLLPFHFHPKSDRPSPSVAPSQTDHCHWPLPRRERHPCPRPWHAATNNHPIDTKNFVHWAAITTTHDPYRKCCGEFSPPRLRWDEQKQQHHQ